MQDEANRYGGKWIVRLRKGLASRCWENLILAMLGEQFMVGDEICGAVVSIRFAVRKFFLFHYFILMIQILTNHGFPRKKPITNYHTHSTF